MVGKSDTGNVHVLVRHENFSNILLSLLLTTHGEFDSCTSWSCLGALATNSGKKTGRSPKDKRVVESPESADEIWWGDVNRPISPESFEKVRAHSLQHLQKSTRLYVIDGFAGWDPNTGSR